MGLIAGPGRGDDPALNPNRGGPVLGRLKAGLRPIDMTGSRTHPLSSHGWRTVVLVAMLAGSGGAHAQSMVEVMGTSAIQGSLSGAGVPSLTGARDRARQTVTVINESGGTKSLTPAVQGSPSWSPAVRAPIRSGSVVRVNPAASAIRVNGQSVPSCSHGGLCHGALLRQMGGH